MRILQVTPYFAPAWAYGGPPRVMHQLAVGLARREHSVTVLTTDVLDEASRSSPQLEEMGGVEVRRFPNLSNTLAWKSKKYLPRGLLAALVREAAQADVVHVTDARTYLTVASFLASKGRGAPLCVSAFGALPGSAGLRGAVKAGFDAALTRPMLRHAALLLAQTDHEACLYRSFGGRPETVRLLPLPLPPLPPDVEAGRFRAQVGIQKSTRLLLFLGRINRLKGLDVLIESVQPLLGESVSLVVIGRDDGALAAVRSRFRGAFADGRVRFVGPLYGAERFAAYADADVFCLTPTHWEETSVAALEAAACGTPVVATEQADVPGLTESGGGHVVPLDVAAIRNAVAATLADSAAMGVRAREHVLAQHGTDHVVDLYERYLLDVSRPRR